MFAGLTVYKRALAEVAPGTRKITARFQRTAVKNASAVVGGFDATADAEVYNCIGLLDEYNANFRVEQYDMKSIATPDTFGEYVLNFDTENKWTLVVDANDGNLLTGRLIELNFLG